jgi:hypothetical protein
VPATLVGDRADRRHLFPGNRHGLAVRHVVLTGAMRPGASASTLRSSVARPGTHSRWTRCEALRAAAWFCTFMPRSRAALQAMDEQDSYAAPRPGVEQTNIPADPNGLEVFYLMLVTTIVGFTTVFQVRAKAGRLSLRRWTAFVVALAVAAMRLRPRRRAAAAQAPPAGPRKLGHSDAPATGSHVARLTYGCADRPLGDPAHVALFCRAGQQRHHCFLALLRRLAVAPSGATVTGLLPSRAPPRQKPRRCLNHRNSSLACPCGCSARRVQHPPTTSPSRSFRRARWRSDIHPGSRYPLIPEKGQPG